MTGNERRGRRQKLKMLYLATILMDETDDRNALTMPEIIERLAAYGVNADRKTLYRDLDELRDFGMDIISERKGRGFTYHIGSRYFELPEVKLLVDSVNSAKFITEKKPRVLIRKLESLTSCHNAASLQRQVTALGRVKTMNEGIYYNVDRLHDAINAGVRVRFQYYRWNIRKEMELLGDGAWYEVSPWSLICENGYYYLIAYDAGTDMIKLCRVDKMLRVSLTEERRLGAERFRRFDLPRCERSLFFLDGGAPLPVTFEGSERAADILIDRFGTDIGIIPLEDGRFRTTVSVSVSRSFLGWVMSLGEDIRITAPESAVELMAKEALALSARYPLPPRAEKPRHL